MVYDDLIAHFKTPSDAARALGVDRRLVDAWKKRRIPSVHQLKASFVTEGKLAPDEQARKAGSEIATYVRDREAA